MCAKFVITLSKSSEYYNDLTSSTSGLSEQNVEEHELNPFESDNDYIRAFERLLSIDESRFGDESPLTALRNSSNILFDRFLKCLNQLKSTRHGKNPFYVQLIAQEIFCFDREIYKSHPMFLSGASSATNSESKSTIQSHETTQAKALSSSHSAKSTESKLSMPKSRLTTTDSHTANSLKRLSNASELAKPASSSNQSSTPGDKASSSGEPSEDMIDSYIEEVSTIREIIQKIIARYIKKPINFVSDPDVTLSVENPGWMGESLCLIALSPNGITKQSIQSILKMKGYVDSYEVSDLDWSIFRMLFGQLIVDGLNGVLIYSHDYIREAVQALFFEGISYVMDPVDSENIIPASRHNISNKQREIHSYCILDFLHNQINKPAFDFSTQIVNKFSLINENMTLKYLDLIDDLIYHVYMVYDILNLSKLLTCFK